jgi:hypothetical protein
MHLLGRYKWPDYEAKGKHGYSYREIAFDIKQHFQLDSPPAPATIQKDIQVIREQKKLPTEDQLSEAESLLSPARFAEWRGRFFRDPATGKPYVTPRHQLAWFWCFVGLAFKEGIPAWVCDYLGLPRAINTQIKSGQDLVSLLVLAPPRHGKTELMLHAILWAICKNPAIRVIYCSGISTTSKDNASYLRMEMEANEDLIRLYGPFKSDDLKWSSDGFIVLGRHSQAKSPTVLPIGKGTNVLSRDADIIVVDDPQDLDAAESESQTDRDVNWLTTQVMTRREPHTALFGVGSHLPSVTGDLWSRIEEKQEELSTGRHHLYIVKQKAHDYSKCDPINDPEHTLCVMWPELRPFWFLEAQRGAMGDLLYEACYNQDIRDAKISYFDTEVLRASVGNGGILDEDLAWREIGTHHGIPLIHVIGFDPAAGETRHASESALTVVGGCRKCGFAQLVDYWHGRVSPETHAEQILRFVRSYDAARVRIEINAYQKALARDPRLVNAQGKLGFQIDPWMTDDRKNDPILGIPLLERRFRDGTLVVPYRDRADREFAEDLIKSFIRWPKRPNDIPMSVWLAVGAWNQLYEDYTAHTPDVMPGWEKLSEHLQGAVVEVDLSTLSQEYHV